LHDAVLYRSVGSCSLVASLFSPKRRRMSVMLSGTALSRPSVLRQSPSSSTTTCTGRKVAPVAVATTLKVTPAQANRDSSSSSPEPASLPSSPAWWFRTASQHAKAVPMCTD